MFLLIDTFQREFCAICGWKMNIWYNSSISKLISYVDQISFLWLSWTTGWTKFVSIRCYILTEVGLNKKWWICCAVLWMDEGVVLRISLIQTCQVSTLQYIILWPYGEIKVSVKRHKNSKKKELPRLVFLVD